MPDQSPHSLTGNSLRVCMIVTNDMSSDSRVARHAKTLGLEGYQVTVVCRLSERTEDTERCEGYKIVRVHSEVANYLTAIDQHLAAPTVEQDYHERTRFLLTKRKNLSWVARLFLRLARIVFVQLAFLREARKTGAHIYCANDLDTLLLAVLAGSFDRRVVYDSHELWPDMLVGVPAFLKRILHSYEGALIKRVHAVMTVNEFIADELATRYSIRDPVRVVYNCALPEKLTKEGPLRRKNQKVKVALYHGWYSPERGLENLARASEFLSPDVLLLFRGAGKLEKDLRALASGKRNVRFEPPVDVNRVVEVARRADVGIVPYLPTNLCNYYASPNKLFEYLEAGLPIAVSNLPFMRKVIMESDIGTLFDARDPRSIAEALNKITRPSHLDRYRKNIPLARKRYNWNVESEKLLGIYAELLGSRAPIG